MPIQQRCEVPPLPVNYAWRAGLTESVAKSLQKCLKVLLVPPPMDPMDFMAIWANMVKVPMFYGKSQSLYWDAMGIVEGDDRTS